MNALLGIFGDNLLPLDSSGIVFGDASYVFNLYDSGGGNQSNEDSNFNFDFVGTFSFNATPVAVPEPSTYALLASSVLTGAGFLARRRRRANKVA